MQQKSTPNRDGLFIGLEVEGPERGGKTLFVGNHSIPNELILSTVDHHNLSRVYFGANNVHGISEENVKIVPELMKRRTKVLIEFSYNQVLPKEIMDLLPNPNIEIIKVFHHVHPFCFDNIGPSYSLKVVDSDKNKVFWYCCIVNDLDDTIYDLDIPVENKNGKSSSYLLDGMVPPTRPRGF